MIAKFFKWIIGGVAIIYALFYLLGIIVGIFTETKETLLYMLNYLVIGCFAFLWENMHEKAMYKSPINWVECHDLRRVKNAIITLGVFDIALQFELLPALFCPDFQGESIWLSNTYMIKLSIALLLFFLYIVYCDYTFVTGKSNAIFHVRILFSLTILSLILLLFGCYCLRHPNEVPIGSGLFWATLAIMPIVLFLIARIMQIIILTYKNYAQTAFSRDRIQIKSLDLFLGMLIPFFMVFFCLLDYTPLQNVFSVSESTKQEIQPIKEIDKGISNPITFSPQNATIVAKPSFVEKVENFIKSEFSNWKKSQKPQIYRIDLSNNSATVLIPQFTVGIAGFNQIDWGELNIVEVIDELYHSLISVKTNVDCKIYVNLYYYDTDKYENKTINGRIYELLTVSTVEVRRYKNSRYFEQNYDIINQITRLPFDKKAIREWEQVIK